MKLPGQGASRRNGQRGYAMVALLVGMSVMAVLMSAAIPSWTHAAQREREEEYLFRAKQYARAIRLWQDKNKIANAPAPTVELLVEGRFLRKKYKDPITNDDFRLIQSAPAGAPGVSPGTSPPGAGGGFGTPLPLGAQPPAGTPVPSGSQPSSGQQTPFGQQPAQGQQSSFGQRRPSGTQSTLSGAQTGGFIGVTSKSKREGIKLFKGAQTTYDQWAITYMDIPSVSAGVGNPGGAPGGSTNLFGPGPPGAQNPANPAAAPGSGFGQPRPGNPPAPGTSPFGAPQGPTQRLPPPPSGPGLQPFTPVNPQPPRPPR